MAGITDKITQKIADLVKIKLRPTEVGSFTDKLQTALDPAKDLAELDADQSEVLSHPTGLTTAGADDEVMPGLDRKLALQNAADSGRVVLDYVKVPKAPL